MYKEPYWPAEYRRPDTQYKDRLYQIRRDGILTKSPFQTEGTYTCLNLPAMEFPFSNGFPILTERKIGFWKKPIAELLAFIHGVRDARELSEKWGVNWWQDQWATPEKCAQFGLEPYDMGPGSYGPGFVRTVYRWDVEETQFQTGKFNQIEHLIRQIKTYPEIRTHRVTTWIPEYTLQHDDLVRQVVVAPCHGDIQVTILNGKLTLRMVQRSADFPIGIPSNMIQYAAFTLALASVTGYEPDTFIHATNDSQIYERHMNDVDELLRRRSMIFPSMHLTDEGKELTNIFDFRPHHFELRDYVSHPAMKLADAVI
jgi:thymidylate synthase